MHDDPSPLLPSEPSCCMRVAHRLWADHPRPSDTIGSACVESCGPHWSPAYPKVYAGSRAHHERLKEVVTALQRLEERERKVTQSGSHPSPQFTALHPAVRGLRAENKNLKTKGSKNQPHPACQPYSSRTQRTEYPFLFKLAPWSTWLLPLISFLQNAPVALCTECVQKTWFIVWSIKSPQLFLTPPAKAEKPLVFVPSQVIIFILHGLIEPVSRIAFNDIDRKLFNNQLITLRPIAADRLED